MSKSKTILFGGLSGASLSIGLERLIQVANTKAAFLQTQFANAPEVTQEMYKSMINAPVGIYGVDYGIGLFALTLSGLNAGAALYYAMRKEK